MDFTRIINCIYKMDKVNVLWCILAHIIFPILSTISLFMLSSILDSSGFNIGLISLFALVIFIEIVLDYFINKKEFLLKLRINEYANESILKKCSSIKYEYFENSDNLDDLQLAQQASDIKMFSTYKDFVNVVSNIIRTIGLLYIFAKTNFTLVILYCLLILFIIWLDYKSASIMNAMFQSQSKNERMFRHYEKEMSNKNTLSYLYATDGFNVILKKIKNLADDLSQERIKTTISAQKYSCTSLALVCVWFLVAIYILTTNVYKGNISTGIFVSSISALSSSLSTSESLSLNLSYLGEDSFFVKKYLNWLALEEEVVFDEIVKKDNDCFIEFENVSFEYPDSKKYIFKNLDLKIQEGRKVALVGLNGCGKTTLVKLLLRFYEPSEGTIYLKGKDIKGYSREELKEIFTVVFQDYSKYDLSLGENISFGSKTNDTNINELLSTVGLQEFIDKKDIQLGKLESDACDLSGGQWQRLAIARALYGNKNKYLIFDEPFSASDPIAELNIYEQIDKNFMGVGGILISHRLASTKNADEIILLEEGSIKEKGSFKELMDIKGLYFEMFSKQKEWYLNEQA